MSLLVRTIIPPPHYLKIIFFLKVMAVYRLTIRLRNGSMTNEQFKLRLHPMIEWLKSMSTQYAHCYELNDNDEFDGIHYHACFVSWNNKGPEPIKKQCKDLISYEELLQAGYITPRNFDWTKKTKGTTEVFVGYLFKESDDCYSQGGWVGTDLKQEYLEALEDCKMTWAKALSLIQLKQQEFYQDYPPTLAIEWEEQVKRSTLKAMKWFHNTHGDKVSIQTYFTLGKIMCVKWQQ